MLDPGEGLVGRVFAEKRVLTYDAAAGASRAAIRSSSDSRCGRASRCRYATEGEVAGVLFAGRQDLGVPFTTTDVLLLLVIADRVGSSLVHQRLLERRGDHLAHLRELRALVDANLPAREPREILARASDAACRLAGVRGALALAGAAPGRLEVLAGAGLLASVGPERFRAADDLLGEGFAADGAAGDPRSPGATTGPPRRVRAEPVRGGRHPGGPAGADARARPRGGAPLPGRPGAAGLLAGGNGVGADARGAHRGRARGGAADRARAATRSPSTRPTRPARGAAERTRVLAALGAGLTRELHPVFATLLGRAQLLLARDPGDPLREGLVALEEAAWRGTDLLQRLLGLAEADQRGGVAELPAIAQEAVSFARARLRAEAGSRGAIEMAADLGATPPVEAGPVALREAVVGLVLNAVEAMPAGGTLSVRTRTHEGGAELVLVDVGEGIPAEVRPRIFDPFFTTRPGHLGLGLSVAEAVVLRAGGRLDVDRAGAGGGTRVTLWLPAAGARPAAPVPDAAAAARPGAGEARPPASLTGSVLVVEEEEGIRTEVLDTLMAVGHRVEAVPDADAALARLGQGGIDVVLTDLALRDRSGLHLASAVKKRSPGTAVVLLTGWGRRLQEDRLRESGVDVMLVKPAPARSGPRSGRGRPHPPPPGVTAAGARPRRLATVDLGTNTVRLLVVDEREAAQGWRALHQTQRVTRLGEGQAAAGRLLPEPMRRTAAAVAEFARAARDLARLFDPDSRHERGPRGGQPRRVRGAPGGGIGRDRGGRLGRGRGPADAPGSHLRAARPRRLVRPLRHRRGQHRVRARARGRPAAAVSLRLGVVPLVEEWGEPGPVRWDRFARMREAIERRLAAEVPDDHRGSAARTSWSAPRVPSPRWPRSISACPRTTRRGCTGTGSPARRWSGSWPGWARCPSPTGDGCRASSPGART